MLWTPNKPIFETKNVPHKIGPWKFRYQGQIALYGPPGDPEGARYQVKVCGHHETNPDGSMGGSWDQIWPLGTLRAHPGPPKEAFRAKTGPFGAPGGQEEAQYQAKVCRNHDSNPVGPICGNWDQIWPQVWPLRAFLPVRACFRPNGPFWAPREYLKGPRVGQHDL